MLAQQEQIYLREGKNDERLRTTTFQFVPLHASLFFKFVVTEVCSHLYVNFSNFELGLNRIYNNS